MFAPDAAAPTAGVPKPHDFGAMIDAAGGSNVHPPLYIDDPKSRSGERAATSAEYRRMDSGQPRQESIAGTALEALQTDVPLGMSPETRADLKRSGLLPNDAAEALAQSVAIPLDMVGRGIGSAVAGGGQVLEDIGGPRLREERSQPGRVYRGRGWNAAFSWSLCACWIFGSGR